MALIGTLDIGTRVFTGGLTKGLQKARQGISGFVGGIKGLGTKLTSLVSPIAVFTASLAGVASVGAGLSFGIKLAAQAEQAEIAFTTLLGSSDKAKTILSDLESFAANTPFQLDDLRNAAKAFAAFGFSANQIVPTLRRIGDISAGLGIPVKELADLYGKARTKGRLMAEDINQLLGRGIPITAELAKQFGVTEAEVRNLVTSGQVNFKHLEQAFIDLTSEGGKFAGLMAAQSSSLSGLWSTLKDNIGFALQGIGEVIIEEFDMKTVIANITMWIQQGIVVFKQWTPIIKQVVAVGRAQLAVIIDLFQQVWSAVSKFWTPIIQQVFPQFGQGITNLKETVSRFLAIAEFSFANWQKVTELAFTQVHIAALKLWNDLKFIFGDQLPQLVSSFAQAFLNSLTSLNDPAAIAANFANAIANMPIDRPLSNLEQALQNDVTRLKGTIANEMQDFIEARRKELEQVEDIAGDLGDAIPENIIEGLSEADTKTTELIDQLKTDIANFGLPADQIKLNELIESGASPELIAEAEALQEQLKALKEQQKLKERLEGKARNIFDQTRTPIEKFKNEVAELRELLSKGLIDQDTFDRALQQAENKLGDNEIKLASAVEVGSVEGQQAILANRFGRKNQFHDLEQIGRSELEEQKKTNDLLQLLTIREADVFAIN